MKELSVRIREKRGLRGVREVAKEIDISPATLSRIEGGKQPDIGTFTKLCRWLGVDPNTILGIQASTEEHPSQPVLNQDQSMYAHLRADPALSEETIEHLAKLIAAVQKQHLAR